MEIQVFLAEKAEVRTFESQVNGQTKTTKAIDVVLTDGLNEFVATAYNDEAEKLAQLPLPACLFADLRFYSREAQGQDGKTRKFQQIRISTFAKR